MQNHTKVEEIKRELLFLFFITLLLLLLSGPHKSRLTFSDKKREYSGIKGKKGI